MDNKLATKVGVIYNNAQDYSMGIYNSFKTKAAELGLEIVAEAAFSDDNNADYSVQIAQMKDAGAELVFLPIYYTPASLILAQADAVGYDPIFYYPPLQKAFAELTEEEKNQVSHRAEALKAFYEKLKGAGYADK